MAKKQVGVWGIDIGQCAFKALRCVVEEGRIVADTYEYIEYPKMLSQPEADAEQLVREALEQFVERNELKGDRLAVSVPGQAGLAKFFKPPPVEAKKIPDLVRFEAKQQIPFDLEDVIWDYQQFGGLEADGFVVDTEIGLFAMKREQVLRAIKPYEDVGLELDIVQLAPLSIYNFIAHDMLADTLGEDFNPDAPPESLVVLSVGTDTTDLVITNGFRMWQRSIPLGGNHFTRQLTKSMKLTFAKAEHLKRNARQAEDPKKVFTAMRPVFNDMLNEIQRSIGYFQSLDRKAKIRGVVMLGNTVRLPGLKQFLAKNLGYDVIDFNSFRKLGGGDLLSAPAFKDNVLSYGVCYGLCLQGLGLSELKTNLLPPEIITERLIRAKKPWAVASVAALLLACWSPYLLEYGHLRLVKPEREVNNVSWQQAESAVQSVQSLSSAKQGKDEQLKAESKRLTAVGEELVGNADRRLSWLEMLRAVNLALPTTPGVAPGEIPDIEELPLGKRHELHVQYVENQYVEDLSKWFNDELKKKYLDSRPTPAVVAEPPTAGAEGAAAQGAAGGPAAGGPAAGGPAAGGSAAGGSAAGGSVAGGSVAGGSVAGGSAAGTPGSAPAVGGSTSASALASLKAPQGDGWVVELKLHHFFNTDITTEGATHVQQTLLKNLEQGSVALPAPAGKLMPGVKIVLNGKQVQIESVKIETQAAEGNQPPVVAVQLAGQTLDNAAPVQATFGINDSVPVVFTYKELGIIYPVIVSDTKIFYSDEPNPNYSPAEDDSGGYGGGPMGGGPMGGGGGPAGFGAGAGGGGGYPESGDNGGGGNAQPDKEEDAVPRTIRVRKYECTVQFGWQEKLLTDRIEAQNKAWEEAKNKPRVMPPGTGDSVARLN